MRILQHTKRIFVCKVTLDTKFNQDIETEENKFKSAIKFYNTLYALTINIFIVR
jgi:hypothetical protein